MTEVQSGINAGFTGGGEQVGNERKWITVFSCNLVKTPEIDAKAERAILLFYEKDGSSMRRVVFESPVLSGLLTSKAQDRDRDRSFGLHRLPKTGPNRCRPVQCGLLRSFAVTRPVLTSYG